MSAGSLKDLYEHRRRAMTRRPLLAQTMTLARASLEEDGADCVVVEEDGYRICVDPQEDEGGPSGAPRPGQLMRASLVAALATGYRIWSARLDVPIDRVKVEVMCEEDVRSELGIEGGGAVGWQRIVIDVVIISSADDLEVRRVVETADRLSPILANLSPRIERVHRLRIVPRRIPDRR